MGGASFGGIGRPHVEVGKQQVAPGVRAGACIFSCRGHLTGGPHLLAVVRRTVSAKEPAQAIANAHWMIGASGAPGSSGDKLHRRRHPARPPRRHSARAARYGVRRRGGARLVRCAARTGARQDPVAPSAASGSPSAMERGEGEGPDRAGHSDRRRVGSPGQAARARSYMRVGSVLACRAPSCTAWSGDAYAQQRRDERVAQAVGVRAIDLVIALADQPGRVGELLEQPVDRSAVERAAVPVLVAPTRHLLSSHTM